MSFICCGVAAACCAVFDGVIVVSCCDSLAGDVVVGGGDLDRFCGRVPVDIVVVVWWFHPGFQEVDLLWLVGCCVVMVV